MRYKQKNLSSKVWDDIKTVENLVCLSLILMISQAACSQEGDYQKPERKDGYVSQTEETQDIKLSENQAEPITSNTQNKEDSPNASAKEGVLNLGNGFLDHGVGVPVVTSRGTVAAVDNQGHNLILSWLFDHRGTYSLLMINTNTKKSEQFVLPFNGNSFTSLLSSRNRYYTHFEGRFIEFDPNERDFTFIGNTSDGTAMSMTEDQNGIIWAALRPNCNLVSYNPQTQELKDYGSLNNQKGRQQSRSIAADDKGWIYVTAGIPGKEKVVAFNSETQQTRMVDNDVKASSGNLSLTKSKNGEVLSTSDKGVKMELRGGESSKLSAKKGKDSERFVTGNQALFHRTFPDGTRIMDYVSSTSTGFLGNRSVTVKNKKTGQSSEITFDYETEGSILMGVASSPNGKIIGGSAFPMIFFRYDPESGGWDRRGAYGQTNTIATQDDKVFIGSYDDGALLEWSPNQEWIPTNKKKNKTNPQFLTEAYPYISRPHDVLAYPDGMTIILAGRPSGKRIGGGLLIWNRETGKADVLKYIDGLKNQSTQSLAALPDGKILGGTTILPGDSGGKPKASKAVLYIMDLKSQKVEWKGVMIEGARNYQDLCTTSDGLILGVSGSENYFVFDPEKKKLLRQINLAKKFGSKIPYTQGQRLFIKGDNGQIYLLLQNGILGLDTKDYKPSLLAKAPQKITGGGAYLNGRIYYTGGGRNRIHSYTLPTGD